MPQTIVCESACTITVQHEFLIPVLSLTAEQGLQISLAILSCWAVAWVFRTLIQTVRISTKTSEENSE